MSSAESILSAFQAAFPTLYVSEQEPAAAPGNDAAAETGPGASGLEDPSSGAQSIEPDPYTQKISRITSKFNKTRTSADELEEYLKTAEQEAKEAEARALTKADEEFTPAWRTTGLPMKPSHLRLDQGRMSGARLVNPKQIMGQYQDLKAKEVLRPPHIYEYNDTSILPNYLNNTSNLQVRTSMLHPETLQRVKDSSLKTRTWHLLSDEEVTRKIAESEERRRAQDLKMPAAQYDLEKKIIHSMHHKLSFLRNPRYPLPPAVQLLKEQFREGPKWNVPEEERRAPPIKANMTARPEQVFVVEPPVVVFTDYVVGEVYTKKVSIRNVTNVIRSLRVFPPASQYFHMSLPRFPTDQGIVAPGMAAEVTLRFVPDSLADYDDMIAVDTATHRFEVALQARRPPPSLTLPQELHVGEVLVGNRRVTQFNFTNVGGPGRFKVIPDAYWPNDYSSAPTERAAVGPFEVYPLYFDLAKGDEVTVNVAFEPHTMGIHEERLIMVCDNCQVKDFRIRGLASNVDVVLHGVDGEQPRPGMFDAPLWFGEVVPGSGFSKRISVRNTTTLPFPFKWQQSLYPQTRPARAPNAPAPPPLAAMLGAFEGEVGGAADEGQGAAGNGARLRPVTISGPVEGAGGYGQVDLVALGIEVERAFRVEPSEGVLQPGQVVEFTWTFLPSSAGERIERWAQLRVDKSVPGGPSQGCDTTVLEVGLEGLGAPLELEVAPRRVMLPGTLTSGGTASRTVTLTNRSRAPAHFDIAGVGDGVQVVPASGAVPPLGSLALKVTFTAGEEMGAVQRRLVCSVQHGRPQPIEVSASVGPPSIELLTTKLDYGLVRLKGSATLPLTIRNSSTTCSVPWSLDELLDYGGTLPTTAASGAASSRPGSVQQAGMLSRNVSSRGGTFGGSGAGRSTGGGAPLPSSPGDDGKLSPVSAAVLPLPGPHTYILFEPASGVLNPGQEQRVNATLFALSDGLHRSVVKLAWAAGQACLEAFACVVTPKAVISQPKVDLGVTFLGVTVKHTLSIRNLSLLPVDFKFSVDSPEDDPLADLKIKPDKGTLAPAEDLELQIRYTPRAIGKSVVLGVCDVEGAPEPTGFMMTSTIKGLDVTYDLLTPDQFARFQARAAQQQAGRMRRRRDDVENFQGMSNLPPELLSRLSSHKQASSRHFVANFGSAVPLGETRHMYLLVTNRTPIHTSVRTWLDQFGVEDVAKLTNKPRITVGKGDTSGAKIRTSKYTPIKLSDEAEHSTPFRAAAGNDMLATRRLQEESEQVLGAKGLAVSVTPPESTLEPWSRLVLQVSCFNDMCGDYFDMLHVKVGELPCRDVPVRVGVAGTPLVVQKERVLVKGLRGRTWRTGLEFGQTPAGVQLQKTFYVFNTGGLDMHVSWQFMRYQDDLDCTRPDAQIFDVKLLTVGHLDSTTERPNTAATADGEAPGPLSGTGEGSAPGALGAPEASAVDISAPGPPHQLQRSMSVAPAMSMAASEAQDAVGQEEPTGEPLVKVVLEPHAEADSQPFVVEPAQVVIKGGEFSKFTVSFVSERGAPHNGYLVGTSRVFSPEAPISLKLWPEGDKADSVGTLLSGTFHPYAGSPPAPLQQLQVDLSAASVPCRLEPDANSELSFTCCSTQDPETHAAYRRVITMTNLQTCPLLFSMRTDGPFDILSITPSAPQDPIMYKGITATPSSFGNQTYLPPRESVDVSLQFKLPKSVTQSAPSTSRMSSNGRRSNSGAPPAVEQPRDDFTVDGQLLVSYSNGDVQPLPLTASILHPALEIKPTSIQYGRVHVRSPKPVDIILSNPTGVDASWVVVQQNGRPKYFKFPDDQAAAANSEAVFGPFIVRPAGGLLPGRGLHMPRTQRVTIAFAPTAAQNHEETLIFAVSKGRHCSITLQGSGSFQETEEHQAILYKI